jgi:predicted Zn finger-like uncharacterized protein
MFRITPEQLKAADGKVRCCQCNSVFNALHSLMESPASFTNNSRLSDEFSSGPQNEAVAELEPSAKVFLEASSDGLIIESSLVSDSEVEKSLDALADDQDLVQPLNEESILETEEDSSEYDSQSQFLVEQNDGLETEPDYFTAGTESQMSELLDRDSTSPPPEEIWDYDKLAQVITLGAHNIGLPETDQPIASDRESDLRSDSVPQVDIVPEEQQESIADEPESQDQAASLDEMSRFTFEEEYEKPQPSRSRHYWIIGSILLLFPLGGQVAWYARDTLVTHEIGRRVLQGVCAIAGCELPIRRDTAQILISERSLTAHPEKDNLLTLTLEMVNAAAFQQPFPKLQLSLYNDMGKLIARRTFLPQEYKSEQYQSQQMMPRLKTVHVELELLDPGSEVTGFKFDFL